MGIIRVEDSIFKELKILYGDRIRACIWNGSEFSERLKKDADLNLTSDGSSKWFVDMSHNQSNYLISKKQSLLMLKRSLIDLMPEILKPKVAQFFHIAQKILIKYFYRPSFKLNVSNSKKVKKTIFSSGDYLISVGLDWDNGCYREFYNLRKYKKIRVISCCYDLIPVLYPQYCVGDVSEKFSSYFLDVADGSDAILCISNRSESDLNNFLDELGGARPKTHVFRLGDNVLDSSESVSYEIQKICKEKIILFVSTIERRKNHEVLYKAYHLLCGDARGMDLPKLVFIGMPGWGVNDLLKDIELDPLTKGKIIILNNVTDTELRALYESASFCVFPSLYEGWGLPVGEALSFGKLVLCSDRGSLMEVGNRFCIYIDPWSPQDWADAIYKYSTNTFLRNEIENDIRANYEPNSWRNTGISVSRVIDSLITLQ